MSTNRKNVIWQGSNGKWNRGFFDFFVTGPDAEWDVEYDPHNFSWVATDLPSEAAAHKAWHGANPGGSHHVPWSAENQARIERYEQMAAEFEQRERGTSARKGTPPAQLDREIAAALQRKPRK